MILSEVELLRVERSEQAKARATRRSGISFKISVAFWWDVTLPLKSHLNSLPYPFVAFAPRFYLAPRSVKLRLQKTLCVFLRSEWQADCLFFISLQNIFYFVFLFSSFQHLFSLPLIFFRHFLKKLFTFLAFCVMIWGEIEIIIFYLIFIGGFISNGYWKKKDFNGR